MEYFQVVHNTLEYILKAIQPFIEETLEKVYGNEYWYYLEFGKNQVNTGNIPNTNINSNISNPNNPTPNQMKDFSYSSSTPGNKKYKDVLFYLNAMIKNWDIFKSLFPTGYALCLCYNIKHFRNKWAHQSQFTLRELYRFLDECQALLEEIQADVSEVDGVRKAVMEVYFNEEVNKALNFNISPINYQEETNKANIGQGKVNLNGNTPVICNTHISSTNQEGMTDDHIMTDAYEVDSNILHTMNYEKLVKSVNNSNDTSSMYKIIYYDEDDHTGEKIKDS